MDLESEVGDRAIFNIYKGLVTSDGKNRQLSPDFIFTKAKYIFFCHVCKLIARHLAFQICWFKRSISTLFFLHCFLYPAILDNTKAVELTIKAKGQGRGVSARVICHAILCSVGAERRHPIADRLTVLPVLMIKGTATVTRYVVSWLQVCSFFYT